MSGGSSNGALAQEDFNDQAATEGVRSEGSVRLDPRYRTGGDVGAGPATTTRPWIGPEHTRTFVEQGGRPAFEDATSDVAGIELGNEPDLTYRSEVSPYLARFREYVDANATSGFPIIAPATSEPIAPWRSIAAREVPTRFFWDWPEVLDA